MRKVLLIFMIVFMFVGCAGEGVDDVSEVTTSAADTTSVIVEETTSKTVAGDVEATESDTTVVEAAVALDEKVSAAVDNLVSAMDLQGVWTLFESEIMTANEPTAEYLLLQYITMAQEQQFDASDPLFGDLGNKAQSMIYDITEANPDKFDYVHVIIGEDKDDLIDHMSGDEEQVIREVFDKGFGLLNAEGSYYAVVDYGELLDRYGDYFTEATQNMLEIFKDLVINQTTVEEYLALTPDKLMMRSIDLEQHLIDYPDAPEPYKIMVRRNLNICLYKLATPSIFDGGINEDGGLSEGFKSIYTQIINEAPTPVVTQVAAEVTAWIATREDGYMGTYNDMEDLLTFTGEIYGRATEQVTDLY